MTQSSQAASSRAGRPRRAASSVARHAPRPHWGRLAILILLIVAAAFYVAPLRAFFQQQNRYEKAAAQLEVAKRDNAALEREVDLLTTKAYIAQRARADMTLVPPGTQVFVIKGLPGKNEEPALATQDKAPVQASIGVFDRLNDLWQTLLH